MASIRIYIHTYILTQSQTYIPTSLFVVLAQNKCSGLVCSCYVPSTISDKKRDKLAGNIGGSGRNINGGGSGDNFSEAMEAPISLKSNLKMTTRSAENDEEILKRETRRKVTWSDAHGKDIAHVHEFQPSASEDGEVEGVTNSCICSIQ